MRNLFLILTLFFFSALPTMANSLNSYEINGKTLIDLSSFETFTSMAITAESLVPGVKFNCKVPLTYRLQSKDNDGNWNDWIDQEFTETIELKSINDSFERYSIKGLDQNIAELHYYLNEQIPGVSGEVSIKSYRFHNESLECDTDRTKLKDYCDHYFHDTRVLSDSNKGLLENIFTAIKGGRPSDKNSCTRELQKLSRDKDLSLTLTVKNLSDFDIFKYFRGIKSFTWKNSDVRSLRFLQRSRGLENLNLDGSTNLDSDTLSVFPNIKNLSLKNSNISNTSFLKSMANLQTIDLSNNKIQVMDLGGSKDELKTINLNNNTDLRLITGGDQNRVETLSLVNTQVKGIEFLANPKALTYLNLSGNNYADMVVTSNDLNKNFHTLNLSRAKLSNINFLEKFKSFENLNLSYNPINDLSPLAGIVAYGKKLQLEGTPVFEREDEYNELLCPINLVPNPDTNNSHLPDYQQEIPGDALTPYCVGWQYRSESSDAL